MNATPQWQPLATTIADATYVAEIHVRHPERLADSD